MTLLPCRRYVLCQSVQNPLLDRREKYDASRLPWTVGMKFFVSRHARALEHGNSHIPPAHPGYQALVEALELLPENAIDVLSEVAEDDVRDTSIPRQVLIHLCKRGILTREQLVEAAQAVMAEEY